MRGDIAQPLYSEGFVVGVCGESGRSKFCMAGSLGLCGWS